MREKGGEGAKCTPGRVMGMAFALLCLLFGMMITDARAPVETETEATLPPSARAAESGERIRAGCAITQTMGFSRCGHSVSRRIEAPPEAIGLDFSGARAHYALWQIEEYSGEEMEMQREIDLFCPMHQVLAANEAGDIVLTRNEYGDGMAVLEEYERNLREFDQETQEALRRGLGFDSREEAENWLNAH